jgi:hypothetical protein
MAARSCPGVAAHAGCAARACSAATSAWPASPTSASVCPVAGSVLRSIPPCAVIQLPVNILPAQSTVSSMVMTVFPPRSHPWRGGTAAPAQAGCGSILARLGAGVLSRTATGLAADCQMTLRRR